MFDKATTTKKQGDIGLGEAIGYFTKLGYTVSLPLTDSQDYDLIVDDGAIKRVQVKTTSYKGKYGSHTVSLSTKGGRKGSAIKTFNPTSYEILFVVTHKGDKYVIPTSSIQGKTGINVGAYESFRAVA